MPNIQPIYFKQNIISLFIYLFGVGGRGGCTMFLTGSVRFTQQIWRWNVFASLLFASYRGC